MSRVLNENCERRKNRLNFKMKKLFVLENKVGVLCLKFEALGCLCEMYYLNRRYDLRQLQTSNYELQTSLSLHIHQVNHQVERIERRSIIDLERFYNIARHTKVLCCFLIYFFIGCSDHKTFDAFPLRRVS